MLVQLRIHHVVLITDATLDFADGLCVLTGETGAGKSILLDSLGLAIGVRAETRLIRQGEDSAQVVAVFEVPLTHPVMALLQEQRIDDGMGHLILRRELTIDGRSRAFINDCPVSIGFLRQVGSVLVEIHSQFDNQRLLDVANHRDILDRFGGITPLLESLTNAYQAWRTICVAIDAEIAAQAAVQRDEEYLRYVLDELEALNPLPNEEAELEPARQALLGGEKTQQTLRSVLHALEDTGISASLHDAYKGLSRLREGMDEKIDPLLNTLDSALRGVQDVIGTTEDLLRSITTEGRTLGEVEERLFTLRAMARKHKVQVDDLPTVLATFQEKVARLTTGADTLTALQAQADLAKDAYLLVAQTITQARLNAAQRLDLSVAQSLDALRLNAATFTTSLAPLDESQWSAHGCDRVVFLVSTNRGTAPAPLHKIASGGEMARFMLAIKVALAETDIIPTLIFDEVDAGVGGAVADSVGERLALLSTRFQVMVVTHAHQIAARAQRHFKVAKHDTVDHTETQVFPLTEEERVLEVARMMSGVSLTDEAIATAKRLLVGA